MVRALPILLAGALLLSLLAACGGGGNGRDEQVAACAKELASALLDPAAPIETPSPELRKAAEAFCRDAEAQGVLDDENIAQPQRRALVQKHARSLFAPICDRLAARVRETAPADALRYLTDRDFSGYADGVCAVIGDYVRDDGSVDRERLFSDHPELLTPWCAASISAALAKDPSSRIPRRRAGEFGRRLCARLVEEGLLVGAGEIKVRFRRGSPKYDRVLRETTEEFAP